MEALHAVVSVVDWALAGFLLTVGTLIATWFLRGRILAALGVLLFTSPVKYLNDALWITEDAEDGGPPLRRLAPGFRAMAVALVDELSPQFVASALKSLKIKPGGDLPLAPGQPLDFSAILGMLPKKYQGWAALAMPMIERFVPGLIPKGVIPSEGGESAGKTW